MREVPRVTIRHMCVDVEGAILNLSRSRARMAGGYRHDDGRPMTREEAISALIREAAQGRSVIPMGDCIDFDYQTGCRGHAAESDKAPTKDGAAPPDEGRSG